MNSIACNEESKILIYFIVFSLVNASQTKITLLNAGADKFCSKCWVGCDGSYVPKYLSDLLTSRYQVYFLEPFLCSRFGKFQAVHCTLTALLLFTLPAFEYLCIKFVMCM